MGSHGLVHKNHWQNESFLVPFVVRFPGRARAGATDGAVFSTVDLFPSLLGLLGLLPSRPDELDAIDVSRRIEDGSSHDAEAALYMNVNHSDCTSGRRGIKTGRYTFVVDKSRDGLQYGFIQSVVHFRLTRRS